MRIGFNFELPLDDSVFGNLESLAPIPDMIETTTELYESNLFIKGLETKQNEQPSSK